MIAFACLFLRIFVRDKLQFTLLNVDNNNTSFVSCLSTVLGPASLETTGPEAWEETATIQRSAPCDRNCPCCCDIDPAVKILFTCENPLPNPQADAEVFVATAKHLAAFTSKAWLHVPASNAANCASASALAGMPVVRACAPLRPAVLRHFCCGLSLPFRRVFREADLVYTRNL